MSKLWDAFRAEHGPRPGGRGAQERWEAKWRQYRADHTHEMMVIKGAANGGKPGEPLSPGEWILTEEEEWMEFLSYSSSGWFGHFRDEHGYQCKLPLAGLRYQPAEE